MEFTLNMHNESFVSICSSLESSTYLTDFHALFFLNRALISKCLKFNFLLLEVINLFHYSFRLFNLTLFSEFLCLFDIEVNFLFKLIDSLVNSFLMESTHLRYVHVIWSGDLNSCKTTLDFLVNLRYHFLKQVLQLFFIASLVSFSIWVILKHIF